MVDDEWKQMIWGQLGAAIDMLENAVLACPDDVWRAGEPYPEPNSTDGSVPD